MLRRSLRIYAPAAALRRPAAWSPGLRCARARHASGSARAAGDDSAGLDRKSILKTESLRQTVAPVLATADGPHSPPADSPALVLPAPREVASSDTGPAPPSASFWQTAWKLVGYLGWDAAVLVLAAGLAVAAAALGVVGPIAVGKLWEAFSSSSTEGLSGPAVHLVAAYVGRFVLQWLSASLVGTATENATCRLRESLFASLLELDVAYFDAHGSAELAAPLADDVKEVRDALRTAISEGLPAAVRAVGSVVSMLYISPTLAIALGCGIPAAAYAGALYAARLRSLSRRSQDAQTRAAAVSAEVLANIRTVRAFTAEDLQRRQYHAAVSEYSALNKRLGMEITLFNSALSMGMSALAGIVLLYGGQMVQAGTLTRGEVAAFLGQTYQLEGSAGTLTVVAGRFARVQSAAERIVHLLSEKPSANQLGSVRWPEVQGGVTFRDVAFAYPSRPDAPVLKGVSFDVPAGTVAAVCGPSGGGKSTLASLIMGFYAPNVASPHIGSVCIDGFPLACVDLPWLRKHVGYVPQEPALFDTSVRENIRMGRPDASDDEVFAAAQTAQAWDFISKLPEGLDTRVGERGAALSGGQRQRVALARALIRNPRLLILDEYSSALDAESEAAVQRALASAMRGRTVFIIAHRMSTIQAADKIIVLRDGAVVETGSHAELVGARGLYAELVRRQQAPEGSVAVIDDVFNAIAKGPSH